jgi:signal peptidase I
MTSNHDESPGEGPADEKPSRSAGASTGVAIGNSGVTNRPGDGNTAAAEGADNGVTTVAEEREDRPGPKVDDGGGPVRTLRRSLAELLVILVLAAVFAVLIQSFLLKSFVIPSSSMSPTLQVGDRVMVDRVTLCFRKPRRGDIVVFRFPPISPEAENTTNPFYWPFEQIGETLHLSHRGTTPYVKRVVASEGETVELRKGKLYVDGKRIEESYAVEDNSDFGPVPVPEGHVFCLGDNRPNSRDSRFWGTVPTRSIIGRVFLIWWPPSRFGRPG